MSARLGGHEANGAGAPRAPRAALLALFFIVLPALGPAAARAADPAPQVALRLSYTLGLGAQSCPSEQVFRDEVAAKMGYDPFTTDVPESVAITVTRSTHGSTATVEFNDAARALGWEDKTIPISDDNCVALVRGTALYLTIQFLPPPSPPSRGAPSAPPPPAKEPPSPLAPPAPRAPAAPALTPTPPFAAPSSPNHRSWRGEIGISPFVAFGIAPGAAFGGALSVGMHWPSIPFSIAGEVHIDGSVPGTVDDPIRAQVKTIQVGGTIVPCWRPFLFLICGVVTGSEVYGKRTDVNAPKEGHNASLQAGLRFGVEGPIHKHIGLGLYGDALGTLKPASATIGPGQVWSTSGVSGDVGVMLLDFF